MNGIKVVISEGQFSGEFAVTGVDSDGEKFSLFAHEHDLDLPSKLLRVDPLAEEKGLVLIQLPQGTLENGKTVTVKQSDLVPMAARALV